MIYFIILAVMVLSFVVQAKLENRIKRYSKVALRMTGAQVAEMMLRANGLSNVKITSVKGKLTDHYDPRDRTVNLSTDNYYGNNLAAAAVACHECGHAIQHAYGYGPLKLRTAMVPVVNFANTAVSWVLLAGVLLYNIFPNLIWVGIGLFAVTTVFSFVTLPVEINASARAIQWLELAGLTDSETSPMAKDALKWAAYTYVIGAIGSLATLIYYILIARGRD